MALQCITNCKYASCAADKVDRWFLRCGRPNFSLQKT